MSRITISTEIDATPAQVWQVVEPVERHVDWMADAVAIRFTSDQRRGAGTRFECDTKIGPFKLVDLMEITEWTPEQSMGVRHTGLVTGSGMFTLAPIDLGRRTRFTWTEELTFPWWMGGRIGATIGRPVLTRVWRGNLRRLKALVEDR
jgi:hypothetical protein